MPAGALFFLKKSGFCADMPAGALFSSKGQDFPWPCPQGLYFPDKSGCTSYMPAVFSSEKSGFPANMSAGAFTPPKQSGFPANMPAGASIPKKCPDFPPTCPQGLPEVSQSSSRLSQSSPQGVPGPGLGRARLRRAKVASRVDETLLWNTPPVPPDRVSSAAARTPTSTRAGGQDDVSLQHTPSHNTI